ncbi:MAG: hypothetical protein EYC67_13330 [Betaproteobacteria bacterium]|nr:MAG: hypothetical protein EYC67_13330 [Betaproteobacteria bacterium]
MTLLAHRRFASCRAPLRAGGRARTRSMTSPPRGLAVQLAFKVKGSPAVLSQAVRGHHRG